MSLLVERQKGVTIWEDSENDRLAQRLAKPGDIAY